MTNHLLTITALLISLAGFDVDAFNQLRLYTNPNRIPSFSNAHKVNGPIRRSNSENSRCFRIVRSKNDSLSKLNQSGPNNDNDPDREMKEEANRKIWQSRRKSVRWALKQAESIKNYRMYDLKQEEKSETDEESKSSKTKSAVTITAFVVAMAAIILRVGGRAALVSTIGLDFATDNPELKEQLDQALTFFDTSLGPVYGSLLFVAAWTAVKVLCVDAFGVVLALASGILFGGVIQGAFMSAFSATVGSTVAFLLAKADTPVRKKALDLIEEYPALRGIEKVVAEDGIKAILTLRLAPILPIPIGMYNYVYGITNVPLRDFCAGIFLGSLKPYLLDSYLGYFGKQVVDGSAGTEFEDYLLLALLGGSVLIGVFASQLASETWDSVKKEIDEEEKLKKAENAALPQTDSKEEDLPEGLFGTIRLSYKKADETLTHLIEQEYKAQLWNITSEELLKHLDPAFIDTSSPEIKHAYQFDFGQSIMEGLVFSPKLIQAIIKYCDPSYEEEEKVQTNDDQIKDSIILPALRLGEISQDLVPTKTDRFKASLKSLADLRSEITARLESKEEK